jgi:hypothetical protein
MQSQEKWKTDTSINTMTEKQSDLWMKVCALYDSLNTMQIQKSKQRTLLIEDKLKRKSLEDEIRQLNEWIFELGR